MFNIFFVRKQILLNLISKQRSTKQLKRRQKTRKLTSPRLVTWPAWFRRACFPTITTASSTKTQSGRASSVSMLWTVSPRELWQQTRGPTLNAAYRKLFTTSRTSQKIIKKFIKNIYIRRQQKASGHTLRVMLNERKLFTSHYVYSITHSAIIIQISGSKLFLAMSPLQTKTKCAPLSPKRNIIHNQDKNINLLSVNQSLFSSFEILKYKGFYFYSAWLINRSCKI